VKPNSDTAPAGVCKICEVALLGVGVTLVTTGLILCPPKVGCGEPLQFPHQEIDPVVGVALRVDTIDIPSPSWGAGIGREQPLFDQNRDELNRKKRIASSLLVHETRQRPCTLRLAMQTVGDEVSDVAPVEWRQHDLMHADAGVSDRLKHPKKWVGGPDLVVR
jgi:hypothetical protein